MGFIMLDRSSIDKVFVEFESTQSSGTVPLDSKAQSD